MPESFPFMLAASIGILIAVAVLAAVFVFVRPTRPQPRRIETRGAIGEQNVARLLQSLAAEFDGIVLNDLTLRNGRTHSSSQIDHILFCEQGIFVIETKNFSGKIYGSDKTPQWTHCVGRKKHRFLSPVRQNETHRYLVENILKAARLKDLPVLGMVVFAGGDIRKVKSVYTCNPSGLVWYVRAQSHRLPADRIRSAYAAVEDYRNRNSVSDEQHLENIRKTQSALARNVCPRCGGKLVLRKSKYGSFYGCGNYPRCTFKKSIDR